MAGEAEEGTPMRWDTEPEQSEARCLPLPSPAASMQEGLCAP